MIIQEFWSKKQMFLHMVLYGWKLDNWDDITSDDVFLFQFIQLCVYDMTFLTSLQFSSPFSTLLKVRKFEKQNSLVLISSKNERKSNSNCALAS